jgi:hypothetical protein
MSRIAVVCAGQKKSKPHDQKGHAAYDKDVLSGNLLRQIKRMAAFAASASADNKNCFFHKLLPN